MTEYIGSNAFIRLTGDVQPQQTQLQDITRPSVSGSAWRRLGTRGNEFELEGVVDVANASAANSLITAYKSTVGTIVSVQIRGNTYANYLVLDSTITERRQAANAVGGENGGTWIVRSRWKLRYAGTPA
ncbi:hypothetical protein [Thalassoroseus pseudoceratinae]|uniref:hypothetical protein n=1 Tax=Thalassoroseus pseudoceratinae TaxID=2713176 RepID=UPI00141F8071|nr:hypothetical protein [Thalassoroseus pseudoceratinae]